MGMDRGDNELYMVGNVPNRDEMRGELQQFISRNYIMNIETDFNNAEMAKRNDIPYDLKALYLD